MSPENLLDVVLIGLCMISLIYTLLVLHTCRNHLIKSRLLVKRYAEIAAENCSEKLQAKTELSQLYREQAVMVDRMKAMSVVSHDKNGKFKRVSVWVLMNQ